MAGGIGAVARGEETEGGAVGHDGVALGGVVGDGEGFRGGERAGYDLGNVGEPAVD